MALHVQMEMKKLLSTGDHQLMRRFLRFHLYGQKDALCNALLDLNSSQLDAVLACIHHNVRATLTMEREQKVQQILKLLEHEISSYLQRTESPQTSYIRIESNVNDAAAQLNAASLEQFRKISFEAWARHALGYEERSVKDLYYQHFCWSRSLSNDLNLHPDKMEKYIDVARNLHHKNPLAYQTVWHCISVSTEHRHFNLESITRPIQEIFLAIQPLSRLLTVLPILSSRFVRTYNNVFENWPRFATQLDVWEALTTLTPAVYAERITDSDRKDMELLSETDFARHGPQSKSLGKKWNYYCQSITECCEMQPQLVPHINKVGEKLRDQNNWFCLTAVKAGQAYASQVQDALLNNDNNYAFCREQMEASPGIPFLFPYHKEYQYKGDIVLEKVFPHRQHSASLYERDGQTKQPDQDFNEPQLYEVTRCKKPPTSKYRRGGLLFPLLRKLCAGRKHRSGIDQIRYAQG